MRGWYAFLRETVGQPAGAPEGRPHEARGAEQERREPAVYPWRRDNRENLTHSNGAPKILMST